MNYICGRFLRIMRSAVKYIKVLLAIYLVCYFVVNATFVHNHQIDGKTVTHSHPFKNPHHSHSENCAAIIKIFNDTQASGEKTSASPELFIEEICTVLYGYVCNYTPKYWSHASFRGPPAI